MKRWLGIELLFVHVGHALLFVLAMALVIWQAASWWWLLALPLVIFSLLFWLYEAMFVLPIARRLLAGDESEVTAEK